MHGELRKLAALIRQAANAHQARKTDQCVKLAMALVGLETLRRKIFEEG